MREKTASWSLPLLALTAWVVGWAGCTTTQLAPMPALPPTPPGYVQVPHPEGLDMGDLLAIFTDRDAPSPESLKECDGDFRKLGKLTNSKEELEQGAREFVRSEPVKYHWCFYGKLLDLEEGLKRDAYIDERQKLVIESYLFLTPMAKAFRAEYQDARYLRWATTRYRRLSEQVFYRRVELTSEASTELRVSNNPFGLLRPGDETRRGVLEKYGLVKAEEPIAVAASPSPAPMALLPTAPAPIAAEPVAVEPAPAPAEPAYERAPAAAPVAAPEPVPAVTTGAGGAAASSEAVIEGDSAQPIRR